MDAKTPVKIGKINPNVWFILDKWYCNAITKTIGKTIVNADGISKKKLNIESSPRLIVYL